MMRDRRTLLVLTLLVIFPVRIPRTSRFSSEWGETKSLNLISSIILPHPEMVSMHLWWYLCVCGGDITGGDVPVWHMHCGHVCLEPGQRPHVGWCEEAIAGPGVRGANAAVGSLS